jgi:hypothetical protein
MNAPRRIPLRPAGLVAVILAAGALFGSPPAQARVLNVHGLVELTGRWSRWDHSVVSTALPPPVTNGIQQRYQLGSNGDLYHPNLGTYIANISLIDDVARVDGDKQQDLTVKDFYVNVSLLPRVSPLTLYAQRVVQDQERIESRTLGVGTTTTAYNLTWDIPVYRNLPRLRLNLSQNEIETATTQIDNTTPTPTLTDVTSGQRTRAAALDVDGQAGNTRYFARTQFTQLSGDFVGTDSVSLTASTDTRVSPALSAATRLNYSTSVETLGVVTPGTGTLQQRSAGASVFYRPSLQTTLSGMYDYYKDPFVRHLAVGSAMLRPIQELDLSAGYRLSRFDVPNALTTSHYAYAAANYRPFLGLSTNAAASVGWTDVTGITDITSLYQSYGYGANYIKTLTLITYRLGYQGNYSQNRLNTDRGTSFDWTNVFTAGLSNTQTRLVSLSGDYAMTLVRHRTVGAPTTDQVDHRVQATATSSAPQNLFLTGDFMVLTGMASYTLTQFANFSNHVLLLTTTDTYETGRGVAATVGYTFEQQSQLEYDTKSTSFIQVRWLSYIVQNGSLDLTVKQAWERYAGNQQDVSRSEGGALFSYYLGRVSLSADYRITYETRPADRQLYQTAFAKASRSC